MTRGQTPPLSIAPMMDRTDRFYRYFMRQITRRTLLYTEMITAPALEHGDPAALLRYDPIEHPVALQLGGSDPASLARCARMAEDAGYDEVNLNVGCPSDRVQSGFFGVCLMGDPARVADSVAAMRAAVSVPVTVKHRIGFDDLDRYEDMASFVSIVAAAGCDRFTVHARKAWLKGLSPKENREIPPLRYGDVHRLKRENPRLPIEINGGFRTLDQAAAQLAAVDAVMIGRAAWDDPWMFSAADARFFDVAGPTPDRAAVIEAMLPFLEAEVRRGTSPWQVFRPMLNLFAGVPGTRRWKQVLGGPDRQNAGTLRQALAEAQKVSEGL